MQAIEGCVVSVVTPISIHRILVHMPSWLGDAVLALPALESLRMNFPRAHITALARPGVAGLLDGHPAVDRVWLGPGKGSGLVALWRLARALRREGFDGSLLLPNAFSAALVSRLARIRVRWGYQADGRGWLLTHPVLQKPGLHQAEAYLRLLEQVGLEVVPSPCPELLVPGPWQERAHAFLAGQGISPDTPLAGIHPGSTYGTAKRWPLERFGCLADWLQQEAGIRVALLGGPGEEVLAEAVIQAMKTRPLNLEGRTDIPLLAAVLQRCQVFICNDSGPMHLAAAVGTPVVALFGPTDPTGTGPLGSGHAVIRSPVDCSPCLRRECPTDHRCMAGLTVDTVWEAVQARLSKLVA